MQGTVLLSPGGKIQHDTGAHQSYGTARGIRLNFDSKTDTPSIY